jgi:hypothetical protein
MAEILLFPTEQLVGAAPCTQVRPSEVEGLAVEADADEWPEEDALDGTSLGLVASLAAAPSQTLAVLARKVEVLVARLASDEENDAGLCLAEAKLLKSVLHDLQAFAANVVFAAHR